MDGKASCAKPRDSGKKAEGQSTRPKAWQQLWLDRHRQALLVRLQEVVINIVDHLVQRGALNPSLDEVYQFICSSHTLPIEKVRRLLDFVRQSTAKTFEQFLTALRASGCGDLVATDDQVSELEAVFESFSEFEKISYRLGITEGVKKARKSLQSLYTQAASEVHVLAGIARSSEESVKSLDDVFVNIGIVSSDEVVKACAQWTGRDEGVAEILSQAMEERQVELSELLQARRPGGKKPVRVLTLGTAGSGKSLAFTTKAPYQWCNGTFWAQIVLLRTIRCRDKGVWRAETISQLFRLRELGLTAVEEAEAESFIAEHPEHVLLVCDGLDEGCVDEDSFLWRILQGESLRGLRVIMTSRPCSAASELSENSAIDVHLQLFGFNQENVSVFAKKYLGNVEGEEMISELRRWPEVSSLMHTPFFALLVCEQFKEAGQLPRNKTELFTSVTLRVVQRYAKSHKLKTNFASPDKVPGALKASLLELGKVAFERLKCKDLSYFKLGDTGLSPMALELGFLEHMQAMSSVAEDQYGFRHLTVQEYLAAFYVCAEVLKTSEDVTTQVLALGCGLEAAHLNTFWVFVTGLLDTGLREWLFCAITGGGQPVDEPEELAGHSKSSAWDHLQTDQGASRFLLFLHCYHGVLDEYRCKASPYVTRVMKNCGIVLHRDSFSLAPCYMIFDSDFPVISAVLKHHKDTVEKVGIPLPWMHDLNSEGLMSVLQCCLNLRELDFRFINLRDYIGAIDKVLSQCCESIEVLDFSNSVLCDEGLLAIADSLQRLKQLKRLRLGSSHITIKSTSILAAILMKQQALIELSIANIFMGDSGFAIVAPALQQCAQLETLDIHSIHMTGLPFMPFQDQQSCEEAAAAMIIDLPLTSPPLLASALSSMPNLKELGLASNRIGFSGLIQLLPGLSQCCQLSDLDLSFCLLEYSDKALPALSSALLCLPSLERLNIAANGIGDDGFRELCPYLERCFRLVFLSLRDINLKSWKSMSLVCRLMGRLRRLQLLNLNLNYCPTERDAGALCVAIEGHQSLQTRLPGGLSQASIAKLQSLAHDPSCSVQEVKLSSR